jgi:hypothetical protein
MWKLKTMAVFTIILGLISLGWIIYDYLALTDIGYNYGADLLSKRRMVTLGVIPIIVFHFSFFATMYFLFEFLKHQKVVIKEHKQFKYDMETLKLQQGTKDIIPKENGSKIQDSKIPEEGKPTV